MSYTKKLTALLAEALIELLPGASATKKFLNFHISYLMDRHTDAAQRDALSHLVRSIVSVLREHPDSANPGAAESASFDFVSIIKQAKVTPKLLIECELDPLLLLERLKVAAVDQLQLASNMRSGIVMSGLEIFASRIIEISPSIPGLDTEFKRVVLRSIKASKPTGEGTPPG